MKQSREILGYSSPIVPLAIIAIASCSIILPMDAKDAGFSVDLIHYDSPQSPFYNPDSSHFERDQQIGNTILMQSFGQYLMKISYGTPLVDYLLVVDTGSELSWIQCLPCKRCYFSGDYSPFNPKDSKTFNSSCDLSRFLQSNSPSKKPCTYDITYADNKTYSRGDLVRDTITVGSPSQKVSFPNFLFGCGHDNWGFYPYQSSGVVGFGPQQNSFISQLGSLHGGKYAFCLAPYGSSGISKVLFGNQAVVSGPGAVSTPLTILDDKYHLMLQGVTIGTKKLHLSSNNLREANGLKIVIDTKTTPIYFPNDLQSQVDQTLREQIKLKPIRGHDEYTLCYLASLKDSDIPKIIFHFEGADVEMAPENIFGGNPFSKCLVIFRTNNTPILGNWAQAGFLVGYDLVKKMVIFKKINCG